MKKLSIVLSLALAVTSIVASTAALAGGKRARSAAAESARKDIQDTLGLVPSFFDAYPDDGLAGWWEELKMFQLNPNTALSGKVKELIGLGVAAQIPCEYCIYFHDEAAKLNGATPRERKEAVAMAALTRHWSTVLNGNEISYDAFKGELDKVLTYFKKGSSKPGPVASIIDAASARVDIKNTLGLVPGFLAAFPDVALPSAWKQFRTIQLSPDTALSGKDKELIGLAVAAQIPCRYCVTFHTEAARLQGASAEEIKEAIAMAAVTRLGSTVLNGGRVDRATFKKEMDQVFANVRKAAKSK